MIYTSMCAIVTTHAFCFLNSSSCFALSLSCDLIYHVNHHSTSSCWPLNHIHMTIMKEVMKRQTKVEQYNYIYLSLCGEFFSFGLVVTSAQYNRIYNGLQSTKRNWFQVYRVKGGEVLMICLCTVKYLFPWCIYTTMVLKGLKMC